MVGRVSAWAGSRMRHARRGKSKAIARFLERRRTVKHENLDLGRLLGRVLRRRGRGRRHGAMTGRLLGRDSQQGRRGTSAGRGQCFASEGAYADQALHRASWSDTAPGSSAVDRVRGRAAPEDAAGLLHMVTTATLSCAFNGSRRCSLDFSSRRRFFLRPFVPPAPTNEWLYEGCWLIETTTSASRPCECR